MKLVHYKKYGVDIIETYYKVSKKGRSPIRYRSRSYIDSGKLASVNIKKDPLLKKNPKLEKAMLKHEMVEIKLRAKGMSIGKAHKIATSKESKLTRGKSMSQLRTMMKSKT
jgi:hypothetical protein